MKELDNFRKFLNEELNEGLFDEFKLVITIFVLSLTIFPFHLLGLNALIGDIDNFFECRLKIGP